MLSLFLNPLTLIAGGLLISSPIIIHLINRIRFRRVKWAAMEFLLKAQKRMRRRKILEQLLLLLLRCLLVFAVGLLFARLTGCGSGEGQETRPTTHVIILDDTPSMADVGRREDGGTGDSFAEAKKLVTEKLMPATNEATTAQTMFILRLSDLDAPFPAKTKEVDGKVVPRSPEDIRDEARVSAKGIDAVQKYLSQIPEASKVRKSLVDGLRKAKEVLGQAPGGDAKVIHVVSDMRAVDWVNDGPAISDLLRELKEEGVSAHLIDVAAPSRKSDRKSPPFSDNVAIVELKPRNRVVSANQQTEIEVRVKNYGVTDLKDVRIDFYLNDKPDLISTIQVPTLPANQERSQTTLATFSRTGTKENPLDRFNVVTAVLASGEPGGLKVDNVRRTVVEVRDTLKVLVVDGRGLDAGIDLRMKPEGDSYYLRTLFLTKVQELGNIDVVSAEPAQLGKMDLRPFTTVYLMNVPTLTDDAIKNVEKFVGGGGGVGVFLGKDVKPEDYTMKMYRGTAGFFPVPLLSEPKEMTDEQKLARELAFAKRVLLRETAGKFHPALRRIYTNERGELLKDDGVERFFNLPNIDSHWQVSRLGNWREDKAVQELYCLQNDAPIADFEKYVVPLIADIKKKYDEPKFEKARGVINPLLERIRATTSPTDPRPPSELARLLDEMLVDQISTGDEREPILREFWMQPEMAEAKKLATQLRDMAKFGDPLYVVKQFGRGRVAVMTTDAGGTYTGKKQWNDWPSLGGAAGWVVVVAEMQKYLSGGGDDQNRAVGERFLGEFDFNRYEPVVNVHHVTTDTSDLANRQVKVLAREVGKVTMDSPPNAADAPPDAPPRPFQLSFPDTREPGAYVFTLTRKKEEPRPGAPAPTPDPLGDKDFVGAAYNVDALNEGDLRRANTDDIEALTNKTPLHNTEDLSWIDQLKQKPSDLSSRRWIYLLILLLLIAEQAWAVRISYHSRPEDLEMHAPSAAAAYAHHSTPTPASAAAEVPVAAR